MNALNCRFIGEFQKGDIIGEGTYGIVFFAKDKNTGERVAIKKMKVLDNQDGFPMTSLRQVKILKMLSNHPNIVSLKDVVVGLKAQSVFLVFQYCEIDLYKLMSQMMIDKATFSEGEIKCLSLQLIKGVLNYAHSRYIIHRDLKLTNLLLNSQGILKIADFGLAREFEKPHRPLTRKVVTLWYRAPELLLKIREYGEAVDTWSIGCIIAELLRQGNPLFQGNSEVHQFQVICQLIGYPTKEDWPAFYEQQKRDFRKAVQKSSINRKNRLSSLFPTASQNCINLLSGMLCWDPSKRIGLKDALTHPYFYQTPKSLFPDEIKVLNKLQFYSRKSNEQLNKKKK